MISTTIIKILAVCVLVLGVILPTFIAGVTTAFRIGFLIACLPASAILFVIANIADDIHYQSFLKQYSVEETVYYHTQSMQVLTSIEGMLQQQFYPQQASYAPMPPSIPSQGTSQPDPSTQETQPNKPVQHYETTANTKQYEPQEDDEPEYKAQFMRPAKQQRKTSSEKRE